MAENDAGTAFQWVARQDDLAAVCRALARGGEIAVDSESNALYAYQERICLVQLGVPGAEYLVDPLAGLDLAPLGELFANPAIQKVFHAAAQDLAGLKRDFGLSFANLFDTMWAARILGWPQLGLADILKEKFGVLNDKRYQRYNWGTRPLAAEATAYARMDVRYLLPLRDLQQEELLQAGRSEEAAEVFLQLAGTPPAEPAYGPDSFWRVKGIYDLEGHERAVLRELYLWRDREARRRDRPPFKVLNDPTLTALATGRPRSSRDLAALGLNPYLVHRYGQALLAAVARGERGSTPRPARQPRPDDAVLNRYEKLRIWRQDKAAARGVATDVILSNAVLWGLAERNPATLDEMAQVDDLGPWKRQFYGPEILGVLHPR